MPTHSEQQERMQDMLDSIAEYQAIQGGRYVIYMLPDGYPLPAPQLKDYTLMSSHCMVIVPDGNLDTKTEDVLN